MPEIKQDVVVADYRSRKSHFQSQRTSRRGDPDLVSGIYDILADSYGCLLSDAAEGLIVFDPQVPFHSAGAGGGGSWWINAYGAKRHESVYWFRGRRAGVKTDLEQECATLRGENEHLSEQVSELRRLLNRVSVRQGIDKVEDFGGSSLDNRTRAAEMLANLDDEEFELVVRILKSEDLDIKNLLAIPDLPRVVRVISWLSACHSVVVQEGSVTRTDFGERLFGWLMALTDEPAEK